MSGFFLLRGTAGTDAIEFDEIARDAQKRLRQSHPLCSEPRLTVLGGDRWKCVKLDTADSPSSSVVTRPEDDSWIFLLGTVAYWNRPVSDQGLFELLNEICDEPARVARRLSGIFVVVAFDASRRRTIVIPSPLGLYAVYVRHTGQGLVGVSSSVLALTALGPVAVDEFGFQSIFRCGHRLPPHTLFQEIQSVPEGSLLEITAEGYRPQRYWAPSLSDMHLPTPAVAARRIADELSTHCSSQIARETPVFSDLTGGFDSRATTACLIHGGIPFVATVTGAADDPDVQAATRICARDGLRLQVFDPTSDPDRLASELEPSLLLSEGGLDAFHFATTLRVKRALFAATPLRPATTVSGAFGECYRDFYWAQEFFARGKRQPASIDRLIRYRIDAGPGRMDFFTRDWRDEWRKRLREYLAGIITPYAGERNTLQIDVVYLRKLAGMVGAFTSAVSRFCAPVVPWASVWALDVALAAPPAWRYNARLLRQVTALLAPRFADHMTLSGCPCAPLSLSNCHRFLPRYVVRAERLIRKLSTVWVGRTFFPEYAPPVSASPALAAFLDAETSPGGHLHWRCMRTAGWYRPEILAKLVGECRAKGSNRAMISRIYTCEAMVRLAHDAAARPRAAAGSMSMQE